MSIPPRWLITCPAGRGSTSSGRAEHVQVIACADCGATPLFDSFDHALAVAHAHDLPAPTPVLCPDVKRLESPEPYRDGMTFDVARAEFRLLANRRRAKEMVQKAS